MGLSIETRIKEKAHILDVRGEVDLYSSPTLREYILNTIKQQRPDTLIINLEQVAYTDSSGIATLVEGLQFAQEHNTRFKLVGLAQAVLEVFQLVRLERVFEMYPTEEEALKDAEGVKHET